MSENEVEPRQQNEFPVLTKILMFTPNLTSFPDFFPGKEVGFLVDVMQCEYWIE